MAGKAISAAATFSGRDQNIDLVHKVVENILNQVGCGHCGRLAVLRIDLVGDPAPDLQKMGVISINVQHS